jgi:hypothetical protein
MEARKDIESSSNVDENIAIITVKKEVNLSTLYPKEEEMKNLFHVKIWINKNKVDDLFNSRF